MFAHRLKDIRKKNGLTQEELARKVNLTKGAISNYENGYSTPSNELLVALANILSTSTDYLLGRTDIMIPPLEFNRLYRENLSPAEEKFLLDSLRLLREAKTQYQSEQESDR